MKIFTHGSIVNFQRSAREMTSDELLNLIHEYTSTFKNILVGTIHLENTEIYTFGNLQKVSIDQDTWLFSGITKESTLFSANETDQQLVISNEAIFDIVDEEKGPLVYQVLYITFQKDNTEITYFFANNDVITNPLPYVAEFWGQVAGIGKEIQFNDCSQCCC